MNELELQNLIRLELGVVPGLRLFRNNVGTGWQGTMLSHKNGVVILGNARPLHAGLFTGSSDLIGWHNGRFTSLEIKTPKGAVRPEQTVWLDAVRAAGGIGSVLRSVDEARQLFL